MSEPAAYLVDLDGTLYVPGPLKIAMALELALTGALDVGVIRRFRIEHERLRESLDHDVDDPFREQIERTAEALGIAPHAVEAPVRRWMIERPCKWVRAFRRRDLLDEIARFHSEGGRTALVSDYPARAKLDALGAADLFDVVVASGEENAPPRLKPAPAGYEKAARALGVAPADCLVIGDRDDADGAAARAAGMRFRRV